MELRRSQGLKGVGEKTIQKLEAIGAMTFPGIDQMTDEQFVAAGILRKFGSRIRAFVRANMDNGFKGSLHSRERSKPRLH